METNTFHVTEMSRNIYTDIKQAGIYIYINLEQRKDFKSAKH